MKATASRLIEVAKREVGYIEKKTNSNLYDKTANAGANNFTKYAQDFDTKYKDFYNGKKQGVAWCDMFNDWCHVTAFGVDRAREMLCQPMKSAGAGCGYSMNYYKSAKRFFNDPKVGDQIFFYNAKKTAIQHTGIVYKVDSAKVYTIEGNTSAASGVVANGGCVAMKSYYRTYGLIAGYGRPKYDAESDSATEKSDYMAKVFKNTSGKTLDIYADTKKQIKVGSLYTGSSCTRIGEKDGFAIVLYKVNANGSCKVGFTDYLGGVVD